MTTLNTALPICTVTPSIIPGTPVVPAGTPATITSVPVTSVPAETPPTPVTKTAAEVLRPAARFDANPPQPALALPEPTSLATAAPIQTAATEPVATTDKSELIHELERLVEVDLLVAMGGIPLQSQDFWKRLAERFPADENAILGLGHTLYKASRARAEYDSSLFQVTNLFFRKVPDMVSQTLLAYLSVGNAVDLFGRDDHKVDVYPSSIAHYAETIAKALAPITAENTTFAALIGKILEGKIQLTRY